MQQRAWAVLLALAAAVACGTAADGPSLVDPPDRVLREDLRIGSLDDAAQALTRIGAVLAFANGEVWVAQPDDGEIRGKYTSEA